MPKVTPFRCIRPTPELASHIAALPYDVYTRQEAAREIQQEPHSFLQIDRAETQFPDSVDTYYDRVYQKARELLEEKIQNGHFIQDETPCFYIYELTMDGRSQTGIVGCSSIDDYLDGTIKKHENTREEKEIDRIRHVDTTNIHTGPIFLAYRSKAEINEIVELCKKDAPLYDFVSPDGIGHRAWKVASPAVTEALSSLFEELPCTYIADGHHRCASAVKVGLKRREEKKDYTGQEEFNRFLSVLFPDDQLKILPYNRVVRDLNGHTEEEFLQAVRDTGFSISKMEKEAVSPEEKGTFGMYLHGNWYLLAAKEALLSEDPIKGLDVSVLQDHLLAPILGIRDPRTDKRIDFVGGIRGLQELERRASSDMEIAFSMYPTSMQELFQVADAGLLMPPKSTWFEPKLRSGLFLHSLE